MNLRVAAVVGQHAVGRREGQVFRAAMRDAAGDNVVDGEMIAILGEDFGFGDADRARLASAPASRQVSSRDRAPVNRLVASAWLRLPSLDRDVPEDDLALRPAGQHGLADRHVVGGTPGRRRSRPRSERGRREIGAA